MAACFQSLKRWLPVAAMALAVMSSAPAQRIMKPAQAILFSSPDSDGALTDEPSTTARSPVLSGFAGAVQAPTFNFNGVPESQAAPLPVPSAPVVTPPATDQMRQLLDQRNNWTLLTPDEILGVTTPEKILGLTERDASGRPKRSTAVERYLLREDSRRGANTNTNGFLNFGLKPRPDFPGDASPEVNPGFLKPVNGEMNNPASGSPLFSDTPTASGPPGQNTETSTAAWPKLFTMPSSPKPTPEQKADMDEFRKLLRPLAPPDTTAKIQPVNFGLPTPQPTLEFDSKLSDFGPIGASFTPLTNGIARPLGMPTLINQPPPGLITSDPGWKPQLPPWMLPGPQPGVIPQRKF